MVRPVAVMVFCRFKLKFMQRDSGQSLIETALLIPVVLLITFNAINFGYFFFVAIHLASAPRQGVEYSIQGFATPSELSLPQPGTTSANNSISWLTYQDMVGLASSSGAQVQICSEVLGLEIGRAHV